MKKRNILASVSSFSTFIMLAVFTLNALLLIIIGTGVYNKIVVEADENYKLRTAITYVTGKIRANSIMNSLEIKTTDEGKDMLCIIETYDDAIYETRIFEKDNYLYECFVEKNQEFSEEEGERIAEISEFNISQINKKLFKITAVINQNEYSVNVLKDYY